MHSEIFKPMIVLIAWTLVMLFWIVAVRLPAFKKLGIDMSKARGGTSNRLDAILPEPAQWPAHNYIHLLEQPTLFYAVCIVIALTDTGNGMNAMIAWGYVGLRMVHSLIQATVNIVAWRFPVFLLSTLCLIALTLHAAIAVF